MRIVELAFNKVDVKEEVHKSAKKSDFFESELIFLAKFFIKLLILLIN